MEMIKKLRALGYGLIQAQQAYFYSKGDYKLAVAFLRAKTIAACIRNPTTGQPANFDEKVRFFYENYKTE